MNSDKNKVETAALEELMTEMVREDYEVIKRQRRRMLFHRSASAAVAGLYLLSILFGNEPRLLIKVVLFLVLPLAAIWFSDELGSVTGVRFGRLFGPAVTTASPGMAVRIAGWLLLLAPMIAFVLQRFFRP